MAACVALTCCCDARHAEPPAPTPPPALPAPAPVASAPAEWRIVNLMPAWWAYWERASTQPRPQQIALFRSELVDQHPQLFTQDVVGRDPTAPHDLDAQIGTFLEGVEPLLPAMRTLSASIEGELPAHRRTFMQAFPDFAWNGQVYFTISLDAFDGAIRPVGGKPQLLFGIDKIARLHGLEASLAPLFHHELFHILHLVTFNPFDPDKDNHMYQALWGEGLAVHVAHELNPAATMRQLVLTDDMVTRGDEQLKALAQEMLDNIDSQDPTFYRDWFRGAGQRTDIPNRVGYFLGFRVA